jgi:hypothetical protein
LAYGAALVSIGAGLVASFRVDRLADPYWRSVPKLRTDTAGALAFVFLFFCLVISEYLRMSRSAAAEAGHQIRPPGPGLLLITVARVGAVLGAAVVLYISVNAFTHPVTLNRQATHFLTWPTESTLRAAAVGIGSLCAAVTRWSSISA